MMRNDDRNDPKLGEQNANENNKNIDLAETSECFFADRGNHMNDGNNDRGDDEKSQDSTRSSNFETQSSQAAKLERQTFAQQETRAVSVLRICVLSILIVSTCIVSVLTFVYVRNDENRNFEEVFESYAIRIIESYHQSMQHKLEAMNALSVSYTSHAASTGAKFPNVTLPDFEVKGSDFRILSSSQTITYYPLVTDDDRAGWEAYASETHMHYLQGAQIETKLRIEQDVEFGLEPLQGSTMIDDATAQSIKNGDVLQQGFQYKIYGINIENGTRQVQPIGSGPYLPTWQFSPLVLPVFGGLNLDGRTATITGPTALQVLKSGLASPGNILAFEPDNPGAAVLNLALEANQYRHEKETYQFDALSPFGYPVFDSFDRATRKVVGVLISNVYWRPYFSNVLPSRAKAMIVVLSNSLGQTISYQVDGESVKFLGFGDFHSPKYDDMAEIADTMSHVSNYASPSTSGLTSVGLDPNGVQYQMKVYPSDELMDEYITSHPITYSVMAALIFVFTSMIFVCYDCLVERRQTVVMDRAVRSTAVVSSLFPEQVRDRILNNDKEKSERRLRQYENAFIASRINQGGKSTSSSNKRSNSNGKPIADRFQDTTVLFADLAGFTKWSASREPEQVFELLEALYGAFDRIAMKRKVFKVETIGDCYMAVTGLPQPQQDHAIIMAKFARDCLLKMREIIHSKLSDHLGQGTSDLELRIGLHSGQVTAGVLRGEKSRFQLFGDTVNTAARMESTGVAGRIHCSQATADLLLQNGKEEWVIARQDKIIAKGKGEMYTYFLDGMFIERTSNNSENQTAPSSQGLGPADV